MPSRYGSRLRFRTWLIEHDLDEETADAILESMPPFDWSDIARSTEMNRQFERIDERFERMDERFVRIDEKFDRIEGRMDSRFDGLQTQISSLASDFHTMSRAVVLSVMAMAVTLAVLVLTVGIAALNT